MAADEDLLWDAADKSRRLRVRFLRAAMVAGFLGFVGLAMWWGSYITWAIYAPVTYALLEIVHWAWDRRRLVTAQIIPGPTKGPARLRLRRVSGRVTEHDLVEVTQVLIIHDNVIDNSATLRLRIGRRSRPFSRLDDFGDDTTAFGRLQAWFADHLAEIEFGGSLLCGRPDTRPRPSLAAWRGTFPKAVVKERNALIGMPGIPDG